MRPTSQHSLSKHLGDSSFIRPTSTSHKSTSMPGSASSNKSGKFGSNSSDKSSSSMSNKSSSVKSNSSRKSFKKSATVVTGKSSPHSRKSGSSKASSINNSSTKSSLLGSSIKTMSMRSSKSSHSSSTASSSGLTSSHGSNVHSSASYQHHSHHSHHHVNRYHHSTRGTETGSYFSQIEEAILKSTVPIQLNHSEEVSALGNHGIWANKDEVVNWKGDIPICEYSLNEDTRPRIITKKALKNLEYIQEMAIRYLRPPTPPIPGDIVITQEPNSIIAPAPPLVIRQQPPRPSTPEPLVLREAPPKPPIAVGRKVITISGKK